MSKTPDAAASDLAADSLTLLSFIVDRVNVGIFVLDKNYHITLWNKFMAIHSKTSTAEVVGKPFFSLFPNLPQAWFSKKLDSVFMLKNMAFTSWEQRPYLLEFPHNRPITGGVKFMYQDLTLLPIKDQQGDVTHVVVMVQDSTDVAIYKMAHENVLKRLEQLSQIDGLTGLYNRYHWEQCLADEVARIDRHGGPLSLILFDLDHFKQVNDTHGHLAGDEVLKRVAGIVRDLLRNNDVAGRYGGEEFGIILPATDSMGAEIVAERLRKEVAAFEMQTDDRNFKVTISLGIAEYRPHTKNHEHLLHCADAALYTSKEKGRNRYTLYLSG